MAWIACMESYAYEKECDLRMEATVKAKVEANKTQNTQESHWYTVGKQQKEKKKKKGNVLYCLGCILFYCISCCVAWGEIKEVLHDGTMRIVQEAQSQRQK